MSDVKGRLKKSVSKDEVSSSNSSTSSFSSDEDSGSDGDLKPIKDYLSNRTEVAKQLFKSVKIEKLRMMLPQVLKKMELSELEEWCASELCGMSKTRILSILNGTPMSGSSDTSDSDGSGPSLEIISDTEEWLTDEDANVKQEPLSPGSKSKKLKTKRKSKAPSKPPPEREKPRRGKIRAPEPENVKIKKEKNEPPKQEGESLLDLLELEMRARAIRALIRKEDIIPSADFEQRMASNKSALKTTLNSVLNVKNKTMGESSRALAPMETSETLVEKIGEDEDVVLLVKPTPTIELISSDSESENLNERVNKKLESERAPEKTPREAIPPRVVEPETAKSVEIHKTPAITEEPGSTGSCAPQHEIKEASVGSNESSETVKQTLRKLKRRRQIRARSESLSECPEATDVILEVANTKEKESEPLEEGELDSSEEIKIQGGKGEQRGEKSGEKTVPQSDDKLGEYEEIIDLDDYPDDMYNIEPEESVPQVEEKSEKLEVVKEVIGEGEDEGSAETWASRYYQTDNVQSVIKESKIQSEIRKRLRERQRLSKLNNSPKETPKVNEDNDAKDKFKPTGSVDEYFALKGSTNSGDSNLSPSQSSETKNCDEGQVGGREGVTGGEEEIIAPSASSSSPKNEDGAEAGEPVAATVVRDDQL
ncbi:muscle M-line assembly protein unc-89 [Diachasma alloeum]|uniref:muscle M-line assembly protein unc-89 n=1 Tax=Diachasma alloeum TaxID=454923 RepID=UPI0007382926|nr:muscle M-line assembly protein unc-89 [Diachasma alloeum]